MAGFSEQLRQEAEPIWKAIFAHPFLKEIKDGTLPLETFQYYLGQDYQLPGRFRPGRGDDAGQGSGFGTATGFGAPGDDAGGNARCITD